MKNITKLFMPMFTILAAVSIFASCTKEYDAKLIASSNPAADKLDPGSAKGGTILTVTGSGLGEITNIVFDKGNVPAKFNPVFNTNTAIVFRVPDTANGGIQNVILTNKIGATLKVPFTVLAFPVVSDVSNYNFTSGSQIIITGNNLADVSSVTFKGSTTPITIVSQTKKQLVLKMPTASTIAGAALTITNSTGPITTTQVFENIDLAYPFFTDNYGAGWGNNSWGPAVISNTVAKSGTSSFAATYNKGNWSADGFSNWYPGISYSANYKYLSFWVKGGSQDYTLYITGDKRAIGYGNSDQSAPIVVPANVWTYFKIPLSSLDLWHTGTTSNQLGFWIKGPDGQNETFYFDDVVLVNQ